MVSFEEDCKSRFLEGFVEEGTPMPFILFLLDLSGIERHIEETYYSDENRFHFNVGLMIRLTVLKAFRKMSFRKNSEFSYRGGLSLPEYSVKKW